MPIPEDILDHYGVPPETYWTPQYFHVTEDYFSREAEVARRLLELSSGGRALDIGAGIGKAMIALERHGFETVGIEPTPAFVEKAIEEMNISPERLHNVSVDDAEFDASSFDFITFGAVLEHLYDPAGAIETALRWLKPGGVIQIEVPSSDYLVHTMLNGFYRLTGSTFVANLSPMHAPFHLYEFTPKCFVRHGRGHGYTIAEHWFEVASGRFIPGPLYSVLRPLMQRTRTGMQLTVFLRKQR